MNRNAKMNHVTRMTLIALLAVVVTMPVATARQNGAAAQPAQTQQSGLTAEQQEWLKASPEQRRGLGERIGERGVRKLAQEMGMEPLFDGATGKAIPQGPDQVYRAKNGRITVFEAKANSSPKNQGYGYVQGSIEHTLKSAEYILKSPRASEAQKRAAREILKAAAEGKLDVYIIRTFHVQGKITKTVIEQVVRCTKAHQAMAKTILAGLKSSGGATATTAAKTTTAAKNKTTNAATVAGTGVSAAAPATKTAAVTTEKAMLNLCRGAGGAGGAGAAASATGVGIVVDMGMRGYQSYQVEVAHANGQVSDNERLVAHGENAAGIVGGWTGAAVGAKGGAMTRAAVGSLLGPIGTALGSVIGGIGGAVIGYMTGDAVAATGTRLVLEE